MLVTIEQRTPTLEWVFLEKIQEATPEEVASYLKQLKVSHPEYLMRAVNTATGKIIDLI